ncbi:MAG: 16S rRNA (cytosine(1402)-N(4))-methyltransferase RsmH, partial [Planctomycetota bacterium]|nr:16S rRNA (cytosine(1402)-N(4))-methyltransferase RsmH [Planctomycetota bacterium]
RGKLAQFGRYARVHHANYSGIRKILSEEEFDSVDGALFDLGLSSIQLDTPGRGFRMTSSDLLDMRMDSRGGTTAADLINGLPESELADIIFHYGEERHSRSISRAIGRARERKPIERCDELAAIVASVVARRGSGGSRSRQKIHPATRTFQALRIAVNEELEALGRTLRDVVDLLRPGARLVVISFHSLEDRIVKNVFRELSSGKDISPSLRLITRKVVRPGVEELTTNPRARSAKLRAAEKQGSE